MTPEMDDESSPCGEPIPVEPRVEERPTQSKVAAAHPSIASLVREAVASEMEDLKSRLDDTRLRLERMELLLFRASFEDFAKIDRFVSQALADLDAMAQDETEQGELEQRALERKREVHESRAPDEPSRLRSRRFDSPAAQSSDEYEESACFHPSEPVEMLSGMADGSPSDSCPILLHPSCLHDAAAALGSEMSLSARREARRESTEKLVACARLACQAKASIGQMGTLEDLASSLLVGSLLETISFMDVLLRGSDGSRYRTAGPVIKVTNIQGSAITFTDGSPQPTVDRRGRPIIGRTTMSDEVFCIVGHSEFGGVQMAYSELTAGK